MGVADPLHPLSPTVNAEPMAKTLAGATADDDDHRATLPLSPTRLRPTRSPPSGELAQRGEPHRTVGRYVLLRELGEGAMGVVYAAYDEELDRKVALKLIHPSRQGDSLLRTRILREAQALARVSAPNVVQVYQVGEVDGQLFIAMEFVNGTTLTRWQAEPGRSWQDILRMYLAAGQGVLAAHQAELVHRDFKPDKLSAERDGAANDPRWCKVPAGQGHGRGSAAGGSAADRSCLLSSPIESP